LAFLVAYRELAIGLSLESVLVRTASVFGAICGDQNLCFSRLMSPMFRKRSRESRERSKV